MQLKKSCRILKHVLKLYVVVTFLQQNYPSGDVFCNMAAETKKDTKKARLNSEEIDKLIDL